MLCRWLMSAIFSIKNVWVIYLFEVSVLYRFEYFERDIEEIWAIWNRRAIYGCFTPFESFSVAMCWVYYTKQLGNASLTMTTVDRLVLERSLFVLVFTDTLEVSVNNAVCISCRLQLLSILINVISQFGVYSCLSLDYNNRCNVL